MGECLFFIRPIRAISGEKFLVLGERLGGMPKTATKMVALPLHENSYPAGFRSLRNCSYISYTTSRVLAYSRVISELLRCW